MPELICLRGYPASGKTTVARALAKSAGAFVVGRDFIRYQGLGEWWTGKPVDEDRVTIAETAQVRALLTAGVSVIVDNTHLNKQFLKQWAKVAAECGASFRVEDVKTDAVTCMQRDYLRAEDGERYVGVDVIKRMAKRWPIDKWPTVEARPPVVVEPYIRDETMRPEALIIDLDGTLAENVGRPPFDFERVGEDAVHHDVAEMIRNLYYHSDLFILLVSGRDDTCQELTIKWLKQHDIPFDRLWMRPTEAKDERGNKLSDVAIKLAIFNEHIRHSFNVRCALDDRRSVVDLWRALGIRCWQVAPSFD